MIVEVADIVYRNCKVGARPGCTLHTGRTPHLCFSEVVRVNRTP